MDFGRIAFWEVGVGMGYFEEKEATLRFPEETRIFFEEKKSNFLLLLKEARKFRSTDGRTEVNFPHF